MKKSKWTAILTVILMLAMTATAFASSITLASSDGALFLRSGPGTNYDAVGVVHDGDSISVVSRGSVWSKVKTSGGKTGYVKNLYIDDGNDNYASGTEYFGSSYAAYTTAGVNLRSGASTSTAVITTLAKGTKVTVLGKNGNFYMVRLKSGAQGFVSGNYLSTSQPGSSVKTATIMVAGGTTIYLRTGPGREYKSNGTVSEGDKVTLVSRGDVWSKVKTASGRVGYVKNLYLKDGNANYASGTSYYSSGKSAATTANVNLRSGASTDTAVISVLSRGTKVKVLGKNGSFYLVITNSGVQGYVSGKYLK